MGTKENKKLSKHSDLRKIIIPLHLQQMNIGEPSDPDLRWDDYTERETKRAFLLAVRKAGGTRDLEASLSAIKRLRKLQRTRERTLDEIEDLQERRLAALRTLAFYNCARAVELTSLFALGRSSRDDRRPLSAQGLKAEIDRFVFNAREILSGCDPRARIQVGRLRRACHAIVDSSVYSLRLPADVRGFIKGLATRAERPVLELWHAQREAINNRLLDPTRTAVVISLPTSTGKTLLAEMAIVQAHHEAPTHRIVYLAPTRALVTQASLTLRRDLQGTGISVRVATPAFELNPVEDEVLKTDFEVLVTTPEKCDLLIKLDHEAVRDLSLVVVDEAHTLADKGRGARLELLLAMLRREREECRFLLMTPFAKNADDLARWLGGDQSASVVLDWKPNDRVRGVLRTRVRQGKRKLFFETLESIHSDCPSGVRIEMMPVPQGTTSKERIAVSGAHRWSEVKSGGVLLLASSRRKAMARAEAIAKKRTRTTSSRPISLVNRYLDTEVGGRHPLSPMLRKGVAFHHAGLSPEARYFVERLVENRLVSALCATTTLAHGVHFPLSAVIIESCHRSVKRRGNWCAESIEPWEFWNIAGRAGRALEDPLGSVAIVARNQSDVEKIQNDYLTKDADEVVSTLMGMLEQLGGREVYFGTDLIEDNPTLSAFLQYLLHALSVVGEANARRDVESLLRGSLAFSEAQKGGQELADALVRLARRYLDSLVESKGDRLSGFAKIADGTGFSTPSVDLVWSEWRGHTGPDDWAPDALFPSQGARDILTRVMETLGQVPEGRLGNRETGEFNPERVARIASAWVNGVSILEIARNEYSGELLECSRHLYATVTNLVPWGLRAIQKVAFAGDKDARWDELDLLPAMVFHGVRSPRAIAMRMLSVPRFVAEGLARGAKRASVPIANTGSWLEKAGPDAWQRALPKASKISGAECKLLWRLLDGQASWAELAQKPS